MAAHPAGLAGRIAGHLANLADVVFDFADKEVAVAGCAVAMRVQLNVDTAPGDFAEVAERVAKEATPTPGHDKLL